MQVSKEAVDTIYLVALIFYIIAVVFQALELSISIALAVTCKKIVRKSHAVPPSSGAPIAMVTYVQQA